MVQASCTLYDMYMHRQSMQMTAIFDYVYATAAVACLATFQVQTQNLQVHDLYRFTKTYG